MNFPEFKQYLYDFFRGNGLGDYVVDPGCRIKKNHSKIAKGSGGVSVYAQFSGRKNIGFYLYGAMELRERLGVPVEQEKTKEYVIDDVTVSVKKISSTSKGGCHVVDIETTVKPEELGEDQKLRSVTNQLKSWMEMLINKGVLNKVSTKGRSKRKGVVNSVWMPFNGIVFGAPGTGKSKRLERKRVYTWLKKIDGDEEEIIYAEKSPPDGATRFFEEDKFERVTFYPTYSYAQFVGTYKPVVDDKKEISYKFVPGPFLRLLSEALKNPGSNYLLIVEEINRANAAAVFGDMFQLLDRNSDGMSEYGISLPEDIKKWFKEDAHVKPIMEGEDGEEVAWNGDMLRLPQNFYIWATMNSADQGVFPLDTAFKRRWEFEYIEVDGIGPKLWIETGLGAYSWDALRKAINEKLLTAGKVNEDKLLGPWFLKGDDGDIISAEKFSSKVLMYLWEDAARMCRRQFFSDDIMMLSSLMEKWSKASGCPEEDNETLTGVFRFTGAVKSLKFKANVSAKDNEQKIQIELKKSGDGSIQKDEDDNPLFTVTFNGEEIAYSIDDSTEEGKVILNIDCDKCYGKIEYKSGEKDKDDAETNIRTAPDAGGNAVAPAAKGEGGKDDTDVGTPTA